MGERRCFQLSVTWATGRLQSGIRHYWLEAEGPRVRFAEHPRIGYRPDATGRYRVPFPHGPAGPLREGTVDELVNRDPLALTLLFLSQPLLARAGVRRWTAADPPSLAGEPSLIAPGSQVRYSVGQWPSPEGSHQLLFAEHAETGKIVSAVADRAGIRVTLTSHGEVGLTGAERCPFRDAPPLPPPIEVDSRGRQLKSPDVAPEPR